MLLLTIVLIALAWLCLLGGVVAVCAAAGRADRRPRAGAATGARPS